ncbi:MAG: tRNA (adenosine(37)-N6)-threonylcarbamoyltransferase complex dimerization subunit type 1 TsaB, partial [Terriglobales bacterium]
FTGLRVGLAAVKALSEALQKPIVSVSLLEAVAWGGASGGRVLAALDAGRGDLYVGDYELGGAVPLMHSERLFSREEFLRLAVGMIVVTPDARLVELARGAGIRCTQIDNPDAGAIARLGWKHLERGETVRAEDLEANYIRRSDAEIFAKPSP